MRLFRNKTEIKHLKSLIVIQKEIIAVHERTLSLLKDLYIDRALRSIIESDLREAREVLTCYEEDLKKLES